MKKILILFTIGFLLLLGSSCGKKTNEWKIVMLTDVGSITDKSFNQGTYEGVTRFGKEYNIPTAYYRPNSANVSDYLAAIDTNVTINGANVIVCPGYLFESAVYTAQTKYPNVRFILIDGEPKDANGNVDTKANTTNILFQEEQAGFLAGYAAVADGYKNLGFMGGMAVPAVKRFGIGFIAGAFFAANELNKEITFDANRYEYLASFDSDPSHTAKAKSWYNAGVEVIFVAAGGAGNSVMSGAEDLQKKVIGVDVDQSGESPTVITSAMKMLANAVYHELDALINKNESIGGVTHVMGAKENSVGLPSGDSWRLTNYKYEDYEALFARLVNGEIVVPKTKNDLATFLQEKCGNPSVDTLVAKTEPAS